MMKPEFKLSFSTWAAPAQTLAELTETARASGYAGLELAIPGAGHEPHAHGVRLDMPPGELAHARQELASAGIEVSCLATDLSFDAEDVEAAGEDLKRYVTLAEALGCGCVRVFGGSLSPDRGELAGSVDAVSDALADAVAFAEQAHASVLIQTDGDFSSTKYVREVVKQVYSERFGVLWDVVATFRALETLEEAYDNIAGYVRHVHVHDFGYVDGRTRIEPVLVGEGVVPVSSAVKFLAHDGYEGYLSVETGLGPPDEVLPEHAQVLHGYINEAMPEAAELDAEAGADADAGAAAE